jgi:hypothetical protein
MIFFDLFQEFVRDLIRTLIIEEFCRHVHRHTVRLLRRARENKNRRKMPTAVHTLPTGPKRKT